MNFELSEEQKAICEAAQDFAAAEFNKSIAFEHELEHKFPRDLWKKACDCGFVSVNYPEEYGGRAHGLLERILVSEEFCRRVSDSASRCLLPTLVPG